MWGKAAFQSGDPFVMAVIICFWYEKQTKYFMPSGIGCHSLGAQNPPNEAPIGY